MRGDFHPRRNQARQKLATLVETRFKDLASDVYHELRRRYPHVDIMDDLASVGTTASTVKPQASQSTNIIPVKGTMNVETQVNYSSDDDTGSNGHQYSPKQNPHYRHPDLPSLSSSTTTTATTSALIPEQDNNIQSLDSLMADLGNMVKTPKPILDNNTDIETMKYEYEMKIAAMTERINSLVSQQKRQTSSTDLENYKALEIKYNILNKEHQDQQLAVQEVKSEMKQLIGEIKTLSGKNETLRKQNEKAENEVKRLTQEVKSWKRKYDTISMELRSFKGATSTTLAENASNHYHADVTEELFIQPISKGAIPHQHITDYQSAINDLIHTSHYSNNPSDVLLSMRQIVMACKSVTTSVEYHERKIGLPDTDQETLYGIKKRFSQALNHLLIATKQYAAGMGISPVSLVDAAAGNLSVTIVDLVKLLGLKSIVAEEDEGIVTESKTKMNDSNHIRNDETMNKDSEGEHSVRSLSVNKIVPPRRNPSRNNKNPADTQHDDGSKNSSTSVNYNNMMDIDVLTPQQLSSFLKTETEEIVSSVQSLLIALRSNENQQHLYEIITSITQTVSDIVQTAKHTLNGKAVTLTEELQHQGQIILNDLYRCNEKIIHIRDTSFKNDLATDAEQGATINSMVKRNLAQEAYEIAKFTKDLIGLLEQNNTIEEEMRTMTV
ncbi:hypothetical protein BDF20DRAFT_559339 [Mycotypha africana]|uniref:uncharacterized protein n=1 Tax=Mycotypha africana TaxID=64632 RepID=UPI002300C415|nr:uncharacterized protein BDF20DRAFT_559339 [Mycotypha africana]KAI8977322.1 hypothetical protein BDF20DRAFT_559339 [Mycotypha africana]